MVDQWLYLFVISRLQNDNSIDHLSVYLLFHVRDYFLSCYVNSEKSIKFQNFSNLAFIPLPFAF